MGTIWTDVTHGVRLFVTQPAYAWAAVVTLALAIGANTVIFSIANVLVMKPLPFERAGAARLDAGDRTDRAPGPRPVFAARVRRVSRRGHGVRPAGRVAAHLGDVARRRRVRAGAEPGGGRRPPGRVGPAAGAGPAVDAGRRDARRRAGRHAQPPVLEHAASAARRPSSAARCWSTASRTPSSAWSTPDIELGNLSEIDLWVPVRRRPGAGQPRRARHGGRSAASPTARRWTRRARRWRRSASGWPASIPTPIATGRSASAPLAKRSPAPTPGSCWRCCSRSSACCWSSPAPTS